VICSFVGWGALPYFSEFSPSGQLVFNAEFPSGGEHLPRLPGAVVPVRPARAAPLTGGEGPGRCGDGPPAGAVTMPWEAQDAPADLAGAPAPPLGAPAPPLTGNPEKGEFRLWCAGL